MEFSIKGIQYEACIEPLLYERFYFAIYSNQSLIWTKTMLELKDFQDKDEILDKCWDMTRSFILSMI